MKIQSQTYPTPNFQARQIAKAYTKGKTKKQYIELYALDSSDIQFGKKLVENLDLKKLYPNEQNYDGFVAWGDFINSATRKFGYENVILAVQDKKPCGIMSFSEESHQLHLSYLAKWRPQPNKNASFVGKVLMHHLFDVANEEMQWNINLVPARCTPRGRSCKDFYKSFGFRQAANNTMNLFDVDFSAKAKKLEDYFEYEKIKKAPKIDPDKEFNITFKPTFLERIRDLFTTSLHI